MRLSEYQERAAGTAGGEHRRERAILGFYGELFEAQGLAGPQLVDELGDRAWYLAEICTTHGLQLEEVAGCTIQSMGRHWLAESRKKYLRGDYEEPEYIERVFVGVASEWARLQRECWAARVTLSFVLERNIAKLADRQRRGVIRGDGGER